MVTNRNSWWKGAGSFHQENGRELRLVDVPAIALSLEQITAAALNLPLSERKKLIQDLQESLDRASSSPSGDAGSPDEASSSPNGDKPSAKPSDENADFPIGKSGNGGGYTARGYSVWWCTKSKSTAKQDYVEYWFHYEIPSEEHECGREHRSVYVGQHPKGGAPKAKAAHKIEMLKTKVARKRPIQEILEALGKTSK
ncbi:hypothetical protein H6G00_01435 [Leptolyngbya sp. FACHB-541]|uniref:hypothetical protein n=1 Tax=Leptolyngbya sp. FACHB-541 TaxID=2692810 RepID=UPI001688A013|nr:hypothetical protein [Leptolyngbya sp. FACHB-541]MBD1995292.1 hypothetical protein [Leptolyngbya sp. FACHB-541]